MSEIGLPTVLLSPRAVASESTGAVAGSIAKHICFGPGRSGQPP